MPGGGGGGGGGYPNNVISGSCMEAHESMGQLCPYVGKPWLKEQSMGIVQSTFVWMPCKLKKEINPAFTEARAYFELRVQ